MPDLATDINVLSRIFEQRICSLHAVCCPPDAKNNGVVFEKTVSVYKHEQNNAMRRGTKD
jgi:hypothetical protein